MTEDSMRKKIIGLGEHSFRKSYYPALQEKIAELELFKLVFDQSKDSIIVFNSLQWNVIQCNNQALHTFDKKQQAEYLLSDFIGDFMQQELKLLIQHSDSNTINIRKKICLNISNVSYDFDMQVYSISGGDNPIMVLILNDETNTKRTLNKLNESQSLLNKFFDVSEFGLVIMKTDATITNVNNAFCKSFGYECSEILGSNLLDFVSEQDKGMIYEDLFQIMTIGNISSKEVLFIRKNASHFNGELSLSLLFDKAGRPSFIVGTTQDITERKEFQNKLIQAKIKAEEGVRLKNAFLTNLSHEIRTPMNGIIGFIDILLEGTSSKETQDKYFKIIQKNSLRLLTMITNTVEMAEIETDQILISTKEVDMINLIKSLYVKFFVQYEVNANENLSFKLETKGLKAAFADVDPARLTTAIGHLIDNAFKFTEKGIISIEVLSENQESMYIYITDSGKGFNSDMLSSLLDSFQKWEDKYSNYKEGLGLGLAICNGLFRRMNITMNIDTAEGKGTRIRLIIPAKKIVKELHK